MAHSMIICDKRSAEGIPPIFPPVDVKGMFSLGALTDEELEDLQSQAKEFNEHFAIANTSPNHLLNALDDALAAQLKMLSVGVDTLSGSIDFQDVDGAE